MKERTGKLEMTFFHPCKGTILGKSANLLLYSLMLKTKLTFGKIGLT